MSNFEKPILKEIYYGKNYSNFLFFKKKGNKENCFPIIISNSLGITDGLSIFLNDSFFITSGNSKSEENVLFFSINDTINTSRNLIIQSKRIDIPDVNNLDSVISINNEVTYHNLIVLNKVKSKKDKIFKLRVSNTSSAEFEIGNFYDSVIFFSINHGVIGGYNLKSNSDDLIKIYSPKGDILKSLINYSNTEIVSIK